MEIPANSIKQDKEIKGIQTKRNKIKQSLFRDDIIVYVDNPKDSGSLLI